MIDVIKYLKFVYVENENIFYGINISSHNKFKYPHFGNNKKIRLSYLLDLSDYHYAFVCLIFLQMEPVTKLRGA